MTYIYMHIYIYIYIICSWHVAFSPMCSLALSAALMLPRYNNSLYVFGGYDGQQRLNDFWQLLGRNTRFVEKI